MVAPARPRAGPFVRCSEPQEGTDDRSLVSRCGKGLSYTCGKRRLLRWRPVDSSLIITALQAAEDRVAVGARQLWKQRGVVARLEREGEDTTEATTLLREMQRTQESHTAHRDQLRAKLAELKAAKAK